MAVKEVRVGHNALLPRDARLHDRAGNDDNVVTCRWRESLLQQVKRRIESASEPSDAPPSEPGCDQA
jgi:hypothetical protein